MVSGETPVRALRPFGPSRANRRRNTHRARQSSRKRHRIPVALLSVEVAPARDAWPRQAQFFASPPNSVARTRHVQLVSRRHPLECKIIVALVPRHGSQRRVHPATQEPSRAKLPPRIPEPEAVCKKGRQQRHDLAWQWRNADAEERREGRLTRGRPWPRPPPGP